MVAISARRATLNKFTATYIFPALAPSSMSPTIVCPSQGLRHRAGYVLFRNLPRCSLPRRSRRDTMRMGWTILSDRFTKVNASKINKLLFYVSPQRHLVPAPLCMQGTRSEHPRVSSTLPQSPLAQSQARYWRPLSGPHPACH